MSRRSGVTATSGPVILQTCLPDYRLPLFERLVAAMPDARVYCGRDYFTPSLALCTEPVSWRTYIENRYSFSRSLLWQVGVGDLTSDAEVVIAEFNPRVLSTWVLLLRRRLSGKRTLLWGHLWGRHGPQWLVRHIRLFMLQLSDGMICYTRSQQEELRHLLPGHPAWAAGNSCVTRAQCEVPPAPVQAPCVVYTGRLIKEKKPGILLEAFACAVPRLPADTKLLLVGDGAESSALRVRVAALGLERRVELPGHVSDPAKLRDIYARSAVAVSPGYVGLSAIQSMAFGVSVLVSRTEPHSPEIEACIDGKTSVYFETDNIEDLADKLTAFFRSDSPWHARRSDISRFVAEHYTFDGMVDTFRAAIGTVADTDSAEGKPGDTRIAVVWDQFGPYHLARLRALREQFSAGRIIGVEIGSHTTTYAWQRRTEHSKDGFVTLIRGRSVERASALEIYSRALPLFRRERVEAVFAPSYWPISSLAIILAARSAGARVVMMNDSHAHTAKARGIWAEVKRRLVLQFDAALVAGAPQKDYFSSMGMAADKIVVGYDAVDNRFFAERAAAARGNREETRARLGLPERYFLNVGRMVWKKNLETLIDAYKQAKDRLGPTCPALVLVGSGKLERVLRERCLAHGLSVYQSAANAPQARRGAADVYILGFRQIDELPAFYALAECFVLPSREEEWGLVVNEAMACGLPVVVSRVAGCARDLVKHGENGFLFDPFDPAALADHLETIARDPARARTMGEASTRIIADWGCDRFARSAEEAADIAMGQREPAVTA